MIHVIFLAGHTCCFSVTDIWGCCFWDLFCIANALQRLLFVAFSGHFMSIVYNDTNELNENLFFGD